MSVCLSVCQFPPRQRPVQLLLSLYMFRVSLDKHFGPLTATKGGDRLVEGVGWVRGSSVICNLEKTQ